MNQTLLLSRFVKSRGQAVRVERVEKKAAIAFLPQRPDDFVGKKIRPFGRCLVEHYRIPVAIARHFPCGGDVLIIGPAGLDFGDRDIGEQFAVWRAITQRVVTVVGFDHDNLEGFQLGKRRFFPIEKGHRRGGDA
ncbi:MAG: hypothetical protein ACD_10C00504G0002 [uncultured bacterium]|nr:MAG: hypothetical protein ACD_10C00504G0002 [uncultured bacterium]